MRADDGNWMIAVSARLWPQIGQFWRLRDARGSRCVDRRRLCGAGRVGRCEPPPIARRAASASSSVAERDKNMNATRNGVALLPSAT